MSRVIIVGGGAAGMMAGIAAAENGNEVHLFEKNEKLGKKLFITGKGRCNITNACDMEDLMKQIVTNPRFLYSAFSTFDNMAVMDFFERIGLEIKTERGMRVFPQSDHSSDVIRVLQRYLEQLGVRIYLNTEVKQVVAEDGRFQKIVYGTKNDSMTAEACIVATGGLSYQSTGSTGDDYRFAKQLGHTVTKLSPSLVALNIKEEFAPRLMGLTLKNIELKLLQGKKVLYSDTGEMLFTHFGISGPLVLSASSYTAEELLKGHELPVVQVDLKPALTEEQLDARLLSDFEAAKNKSFKNSLDKLLPQRMIEVIVELSGIDPEKKVNAISKEERRQLGYLLKHLTMHVTGLRDYKEAVITKGGISVKEIVPSTMESKLVSGLYFAGEVLDVDAMTGGFNLQIAWSTGYAAGSAVY
ncbi:MAG: NAD(P)/FAD-dependent oxidoreductase [Lachnospiraceae bacterium]|nr:NAD(P)/FAD-dependent oxidoreductase [Lachnospiraceae bacterium]